MKATIPRLNDVIYLLLIMGTTDRGEPYADYQFIRRSQIPYWIEKSKKENIDIKIARITKAQFVVSSIKPSTQNLTFVKKRKKLHTKL